MTICRFGSHTSLKMKMIMMTLVMMTTEWSRWATPISCVGSGTGSSCHTGRAVIQYAVVGSDGDDDDGNIILVQQTQNTLIAGSIDDMEIMMIILSVSDQNGISRLYIIIVSRLYIIIVSRLYIIIVYHSGQKPSICRFGSHTSSIMIMKMIMMTLLVMTTVIEMSNTNMFWFRNRQLMSCR